MLFFIRQQWKYIISKKLKLIWNKCFVHFCEYEIVNMAVLWNQMVYVISLSWQNFIMKLKYLLLNTYSIELHRKSSTDVFRRFRVIFVFHLQLAIINCESIEIILLFFSNSKTSCKFDFIITVKNKKVYQLSTIKFDVNKLWDTITCTWYICM